MNEQSEGAIRERIDETRARMGHTIEKIGDRVNPGRVKNDLKARATEEMHEARDNVKRKARAAMRNVEHGVESTGRGIWDTIKDNPIPAGMIGMGIAWLAAASRRDGDGHDYEYGYGSRYESGGYGFAGGETYREFDSERRNREQFTGDRSAERISDLDFSRGDTTASWGPESGDGDQGIREKASDALHGVTDRASEIAHETRDRIGGISHDARSRGRGIERRMQSTMRENPIAAGALALAAGMAAGLLIPETDRERRTLGHARERLMDRAQEFGHTASSKIHESAREAAGEAARHAVDGIWPGESESHTHGYSGSESGGRDG